MNPITLAQAFRDGEVYGPRGPIKAAAAMLTRRSLLVFTAQSVLKLRVPDVIDGLDQTSLGVRIGLTARERAVGRRLCPHAVLDDCALRLSTEKELLLVHELKDGEPIVATWRQPSERQADVVIEAGLATPDAFFRLAEALARFHGDSDEPRPEARWLPRALTHWSEALGALAAAPPSVLDDGERGRLDAASRAWIAANDKILVHRTAERRVRELHGELSLEHVFLVDPPVVVDCADVATTDERYADVAEDVMRLAMELDLVAGPELSEPFVRRYAAATLDARLADVAPFFKRMAALRAAADVLSEPALESRLERARVFVEHALAYDLGV